MSKVDLRLGDCREWIDSVEGVLIADPPYGMNLKTNYRERGRGNLTESNDYAPVYGDDKAFDPTHLLRFKKVILFGANYYSDKLPVSHTWLVWDKRDGIAYNDNADCELAWGIGIKGTVVRVFHHMWNGMLKDSERDQKRVHPTQKPVALMKWCIERMELEPDSTIIDPYMGSGSTGVAAVEMGFNFIGGEISPDYFNISKNRIERASSQLLLF